MCLYHVYDIVCNSGFGVFVAKKCSFYDCPCIVRIEILMFG